jgi:hypothetical protein
LTSTSWVNALISIHSKSISFALSWIELFCIFPNDGILKW